MMAGNDRRCGHDKGWAATEPSTGNCRGVPENVEADSTTAVGASLQGHRLTQQCQPKYAVSSTLENPDWNNTAVLQGDVVNAVSKLKQKLAGDIVVAAGFQLVHTLIEYDLVDELRLMIYPVVLGAGERLFGETRDKKPLRLIDTRTVADLAYLTYQPARDA